MKNAYIGIIIAMAVVVLIELTYISQTSLAYVLIAIAVSVGVLAYGQVKK
jgi:hypothetical protein